MESVQHIRDAEASVLLDVKKSNGIVAIKKFLKGEYTPTIKFAAFHSLRRIFLNFLEKGLWKTGGKKNNANNKTINNNNQEFKSWFTAQFKDYKEVLCQWIISGDIDLQVPAIRTLIEFVKKDYFLLDLPPQAKQKCYFGVESFKDIIRSLLFSSELSADLLIMLRDEVFSKPDCKYYAFIFIVSTLRAYKSTISSENTGISSSKEIITNSLDLLRVIDFDEDIVEENLLCDGLVYNGNNNNDDEDDDDENDHSSSESEDNDGDGDGDKNDDKGLKRKKSGVQAAVTKKKRRVTELTRAEQILDPASHKRMFNKAWIAFLSLPLDITQHKLVLQHLPDHVVPHLLKPLLLADYLTCCYERGGTIAVLSLQSLFQLIAMHNLDYPKYFESLYALCTVEVLGAKYRSKFMHLLHTSLKSANLPSYSIAAFIKRLTRLGLRIAGPAALFCMAQATWLLRRHPQCQLLIHRTSDAKIHDNFNEIEDIDLEKADALSSSLWETCGLQNHYIHDVSVLAQALENEKSTSSNKNIPELSVASFMSHNYSDLIEVELKRIKKFSALAFQEPNKLILPKSSIDLCFGF